MINVTNVVTFLLGRVKQVYKHEKTNVTAEERDVAYQLFLTLQSVIELPGNIEKEAYLEFAESYEIDNDDDEDIYSEEFESSQSSQEWEYF